MAGRVQDHNYGFESFDLLSVDGFLFHDTASIELELARAAVEEALLKHGSEDVTAASRGADGAGLLAGSGQGGAESSSGLGLAQAAREDAPAPDSIGNGAWPALDFTNTVSSFPAPASARPSPTVSAGDITVLEPQLSGAKGGVPGPPSGGGDNDGGGDGGGGDGGVMLEYKSGSTNDGAGYDIWIEFIGSDWTVNLQQAFIQSADYLTTVITNDIGGGGKFRGKVIDDIYISAEVKAIDGPGKVLGQAGPTALWSATELPAAGMMEFDVADADVYYGFGLWDDIVMHEMMHVLGFGSLWNYGRHAALVDGAEYTGSNALAAYRETVDGATFIPVERDGGSGTAGAHWDEVELNNELMTGYINNDGSAATNDDNYLSKFSVMALADLGYVVQHQDYPYDNPPIGDDALIA